MTEAVAKRLETGAILADGHRDHCGARLRLVDGEYIHGEVSEGMLPCFGAARGQERFRATVSFRVSGSRVSSFLWRLEWRQK